MRDVLIKAIENNGYNPNQVAVALGFHKTTLYNHLKNRGTLGIDKARRLAALLNITLEDIYAESNN